MGWRNEDGRDPRGGMGNLKSRWPFCSAPFSGEEGFPGATTRSRIGLDTHEHRQDDPNR